MYINILNILEEKIEYLLYRDDIYLLMHTIKSPENPENEVLNIKYIVFILYRVFLFLFFILCQIDLLSFSGNPPTLQSLFNYKISYNKRRSSFSRQPLYYNFVIYDKPKVFF